MKKQSLIKGSIILGTAGIIAKFLGLFFRWPLILLIGDEGIGYYSTAFDIYNVLLLLSSQSMPLAVSKIVSEKLNMLTKEKKIVFLTDLHNNSYGKNNENP